MSNIAIHTENLGKRYQLGATVDFSRTFREVLLGLPRHFYRLSKSKAQRLLDKNEYPKDTPKDTFWALRDINLDIEHGDVVGIIGRNGAGKSTLLKILSKITTPTTGFARINGRVGSLLEVGTGFHPELTGRENIYLNGSILGMRKNEIQKKFDEIVAFAEVEQFLDTPIKRYSSGMNVRLAFAVAAHLEPEILIVDEVLAVGDAAFQKKCLGKMEDVSKQGRTVLFVSHNMGAVRNLCPKSILLNSGEVEMLGDTNDVIDCYFKNMQVSPSTKKLNDHDRKSSFGSELRIVDGWIENNKNEKVNTISSGESICFNFLIRNLTDKYFNSFHFDIILNLVPDQNIATISSRDSDLTLEFKPQEERAIRIMVQNLNLKEGEYDIITYIGKKNMLPFDYLKNILNFKISSDVSKQLTKLPGIVFYTSQWEVINDN